MLSAKARGRGEWERTNSAGESAQRKRLLRQIRAPPLHQLLCGLARAGEVSGVPHRVEDRRPIQCGDGAAHVQIRNPIPRVLGPPVKTFDASKTRDHEPRQR